MTVILMPRRTRIWWVLAVLFTLINLGGLLVAARSGETPHAVVHVVLMVLGIYVARRLRPRRAAMQ